MVEEKKMREALIVWGGWSGHEPEQCAVIIKSMLEEDGFKVYVENTTEAFADPTIHDLSLIVPIFTMSKIEKEELSNLTAAVAGGVGLGGYHGGMGDAFRDAVDYQFMVGGQWVAHPGNVIDYRVDVTRSDDPIMEGIESFPYTSEQYYMHVDPSNEVLATTTFTGEHAYWIDGVTMPVVWKRKHGKGRVFYSSLGHVSKEFEVPQMRTILGSAVATPHQDRRSSGAVQLDRPLHCIPVLRIPR
jgi:type 1 glutamine amidotransferase